jgi:hypothetical protein
MNLRSVPRRTLLTIGLPFALALAGCATGVAEKPLPKAWRPANTFDDAPRVIPLARPYTYKILVVDRTLMQLVRRWSKDTQVANTYRCADDFTLPKRLVGKTFVSLDEAIAEVNSTYYLFGTKLILDSKNEFRVECTNRDVLTGIVRLPQEMNNLERGPQPVLPSEPITPEEKK